MKIDLSRLPRTSSELRQILREMESEAELYNELASKRAGYVEGYAAAMTKISNRLRSLALFAVVEEANLDREE